MRIKTIGGLGVGAAILAGACVTGYAFGGFYYAGSEGTVVPASATALLSCYAVDSGLELQSGANRPDVLADVQAARRGGR